MHIAMSNQHICKKKSEPPKSLISPFPSSAFRSQGSHVFCSHKGYPSCAATGTGLSGFKCANRYVFVTRFSQVPGLTLFCLACSRSLLPLLSPSSTSPADQLSSRCTALTAGACRLAAGCYRVLKPTLSPAHQRWVGEREWSQTNISHYQ